VARKSHLDYLFPSFQANAVKLRVGGVEKPGVLIISLSSFISVTFTSALILHFGVLFHIPKSRRCYNLGGQDYSNKAVSWSTGNITSCPKIKGKKEAGL